MLDWPLNDCILILPDQVDNHHHIMIWLHLSLKQFLLTPFDPLNFLNQKPYHSMAIKHLYESCLGID